MTARLHDDLGLLQSRALLVGVVGLVASVFGGMFNAKQFFVSYLFSYLFWIGLAVGCFLVAMIHYLTGGRWGHPIRRVLEAGFSTLPLFAVLFIPIFFGLKHLYPWAQQSALPEVLKAKQPYLSAAFFGTRVLLILIVWSALAMRLRKYSLAQDRTADPQPTRALSTWSGPGLIIVPLTATILYVDWIMSLEARWYSTIFAIVVLAGQVLLAYAFSVILLKTFEHISPIREVVSRSTYIQLGNLLLTFVLFWTYVGFSQLLIIYAGNKPDEISWYLHRIAGGWRYVAGLVALFHFFLPFVLLLFRGFKNQSRYLASLGALLMAVHLLYSYWLVSPSIFQDGIHLSWLNFVVPVGLGGIWLAAFFASLRRAPFLPLNDPRMQAVIAREEAR